MSPVTRAGDEPEVASESTLALTIDGRSTEIGRGRGLVALPDRIVFVFCVLFAVAAACATFRGMFWWLFLPLLIIVVAVTWRFMPQATPTGRAHRLGAVIAIGYSLVWLCLNVPFASQYLVAIRDPGIYMLVGAVISHTGGSPIDVTAAHSLAGSVPGLTDAMGVFGGGDKLTTRLQGSNGVPALFAIGYWIAGVNGAIVVNLVVGAVGLIALYSLGRKFLGPYWGLAPVVLLSLAMPYIYLSRTSYTEPMATLLIVAASTWLIGAFGTRRISDFVIAGALTGAASLTRVDGALAFVGALIGLVLVVIGVGRTRIDVALRWPLIGFAVGGWVFVGLGMIDLFHNNARYLYLLGALPKQLWLGSAAVTIVLVVACLTRLGTKGFEYRRALRPLAVWVTIALAAIFVFWFSRPYWLVERGIKPGPYQQAIAGLQAQDGLPIDPSRNYNEYSLWWYGWYFGWVFLALAVAGMCLWMYWAISRRNAAHIVILATAAVVSVLYLDELKVTPDQIWAFRRVLPVITPALVLAAGIALRWLWVSRRRWAHPVLVVAVIGCLIGVFLPWGRIMVTVEGSDQAAEIEQICGSIGDASTVAFVENGAPANYALTVRAVCNVQLVTVQNTTSFDWKRLAERAPGGVAVVTYEPQAVPWVHSPASATKTSVVRTWTSHLLSTPRTASISVRSVYVGRLGADGKVTFARR